MKKNILLFFILFAFISLTVFCSAHLPRIVYDKLGNIQISEPESSQAFFDELNGSSRNYLISSENDFTLFSSSISPK